MELQTIQDFTTERRNISDRCEPLFWQIGLGKIESESRKSVHNYLKKEVAYATRDLNLTITGNGTVKAGSKELVSGTNAVSKNEVVLSFVPVKTNM